VGIVIGVAPLAWRVGPWSSWGFQEFRLPNRTDIPVGIAAARDGTVWFTLESSDTIGLFRDGQIQKLPKGTESVEPLGLAVDSAGRAWYTEAPKQKIGRASSDGTITAFSLETPVARLGRLAIAPDGAVWFAEASLVSVTHLKDGRLRRHIVGSLTPTAPLDAAPFGVAVAHDGTVWATLPNANKLLRIGPDGEKTAFDVPTRQSGLGDIAVDGSGAVWFLEIGANKIGRFVGGRFEEVAVPTRMRGSPPSPSLRTGPCGSRSCGPIGSAGCTVARSPSSRFLDETRVRSESRSTPGTTSGTPISAAGWAGSTPIGRESASLGACRRKARGR